MWGWLFVFRGGSGSPPAQAGTGHGEGYPKGDFTHRDSSPASSLSESSRDSSPEPFPSREPSPFELPAESSPVTPTAETPLTYPRFNHRHQLLSSPEETPLGLWQRRDTAPVQLPNFWQSSGTSTFPRSYLQPLQGRSPGSGFGSAVETLLPRPLRWLGRLGDRLGDLFPLRRGESPWSPDH